MYCNSDVISSFQTYARHMTRTYDFANFPFHTAIFSEYYFAMSVAPQHGDGIMTIDYCESVSVSEVTVTLCMTVHTNTSVFWPSGLCLGLPPGELVPER